MMWLPIALVVIVRHATNSTEFSSGFSSAQGFSALLTEKYVGVICGFSNVMCLMVLC